VEQRREQMDENRITNSTDGLTDEEIKRVNLKQNKFHGEWNYTIYPSSQ